MKSGSRAWFYEWNESPTGPLTEDEMMEIIENQRIAAHTFVWTAEFKNAWRPAGLAWPKRFRDATEEDLLPPTPAWQRLTAYCLMFLAMGSMVAAGVTFWISIKAKPTPPTKSVAASSQPSSDSRQRGSAAPS